MSGMTAIERLALAKAGADQSANDRKAYKRFIDAMTDSGWSESDVSEYAANIKVLMGKDDAAAMSLFPSGVFKLAEEARDSARKFWRERVA